MKLTKLIPEIKIVPRNTNLVKLYNLLSKKFKNIEKITKNKSDYDYDNQGIEGILVSYEVQIGDIIFEMGERASSLDTNYNFFFKRYNPNIYNHTKIWNFNTIEELLDFIKYKFQILNEIKIVPNTRPKLFSDWLKDEFHPQLVKRISSDLNNIGIYDILDTVFQKAKTDRLQELLKSIIKNDDIESEIDVDRASDKDIIEFVDQNKELHDKIIKAFTQFYWSTIDYKALNELFIKEVEHQMESNYDFEDDSEGYIRWAGEVTIDIGYDTELILEPLDAAWYKCDELENILYKYLQKSYEFLAEIKIIPNLRRPQVGDIYKSTISKSNHHSSLEGEITIEKDYDEDWFLVINGRWGEGRIFMEKGEFNNFIKAGRLKLIKQSTNEIKIIPNQKIDTPEKLLYFVNRNKEDIIQDILLIINHRGSLEYMSRWERDLIETPCKLYGLIIKIQPEDTESLWLSLVNIHYENDYIIYKDVKIYFS